MAGGVFELCRDGQEGFGLRPTSSGFVRVAVKGMGGFHLSVFFLTIDRRLGHLF